MLICHAAATKCPGRAKKYPNLGLVKPQFISILLNDTRSNEFYCLTGMVTVMCTTTISTLTLAALLEDPLIQLVRRSDNVSEEDHSDLLFRVKNSLIARASVLAPAFQAG